MQPEVKWIMEYLDSHEVLPEIYEIMNALFIWSCQDHGYDSKNHRIKEWNHNLNLKEGYVDPYYEIVTKIFIGVLLHPEGMTYQAMIGYISGNIGCKDPLDRAKCAAEVIAFCYECDLIIITKTSDQTMMITTEFELPIDIPEFGKHIPLFKKPEEVSYNPILGNQFKQHGADTCRQHIDLMSSIPLTLEYRVINGIEEYQKFEPETDEQEEQWTDFQRRSFEAYSEVANHDKFYLNHSYDTRGRCYCSGYYINYQGSGYKKAIVQLAEREVVKL